MREVQRIDLLVENAVDGSIANEGLEAPLQLLHGHLFSPSGQQAEQAGRAVARQGARLVAVHRLERLLDLLRSDGKHRPMVDEQSDEVLEADPVNILPGFTELGILDLGCHVLDLQQRREITQCAHQVRDLIDWDGAVQVARLRCVLVLGPNLRIVEIVLHVREELSVLATVEQLDIGLDAGTTGDVGIGDRLRIDQPLIDGQVRAAASEGVLALVIDGDGRDLPGVSDQTHALVRIPVQGKLHEAEHLLMGGIQHELFLAVRACVHRGHLRHGIPVSWSQGRPPARPVGRVPDLELVLIVHGQDLLIVAFATKRVPHATGGSRLLLHHGVWRHDLGASELRPLDAVLNEATVLTQREQTELVGLVTFRPGETQPHDRPPMGLVLPAQAPLLGVVFVAVPVREAKDACAPVGMRQRQVRGVVAEYRMRHAISRLAEGDNLAQIGRLEQLAKAIREPNSENLAVRRELKYVRHELLENLDEVQGPRIVVPQVQEAGVPAHRDQRQAGVAAQTMHRRIQALQDEPPSPVVRRQLVEETGLDEDHKCRACAHQEVRALEVVLDAHAAACAGCLEVLVTLR
mmetsp:Transcript_17594/g.50021  ORF Transcript_17594/g.50021 Transcript_17594/m.50021 type:complete len:577 (-) Transcript_17594:1085-2815(-)